MKKENWDLKVKTDGMKKRHMGTPVASGWTDKPVRIMKLHDQRGNTGWLCGVKSV